MFTTELDALNAIYDLQRSMNLLSALLVLLVSLLIGLKLAFCIRRSWVALFLVSCAMSSPLNAQDATESTLQSVNAKLSWIYSDVSAWRTEANDFYYDNLMWLQNQNQHQNLMLENQEFQLEHVSNTATSVSGITNLLADLGELTNLLQLVDNSPTVPSEAVIEGWAAQPDDDKISDHRADLLAYESHINGNDHVIDEAGMAIDTRENEITPALDGAVTALDSWLTFPVIAKNSLISVGHPAFLLFNSISIQTDQWGLSFDLAEITVAGSIRIGLLAAFAIGWVVVAFKTLADGIA